MCAETAAAPNRKYCRPPWRVACASRLTSSRPPPPEAAASAEDPARGGGEAHREEERDAEPYGGDLRPHGERETCEAHDGERTRRRRDGEVLVRAARAEEDRLAQRVGRDQRRADGGPTWLGLL